MAVYSSTLNVRTKKKVELVDISAEAEEIVRKSNVSVGVASLFVPHTTAGIAVNEGEASLVGDIEGALQELVPWDGDFGHNNIDSNAAAHIVSTMLGGSVTCPVNDGRIALGTWQSVFFVELDGPRARKVVVHVLGE